MVISVTSEEYREIKYNVVDGRRYAREEITKIFVIEPISPKRITRHKACLEDSSATTPAEILERRPMRLLLWGIIWLVWMWWMWWDW